MIDYDFFGAHLGGCYMLYVDMDMDLDVDVDVVRMLSKYSGIGVIERRRMMELMDIRGVESKTGTKTAYDPL